MQRVVPEGFHTVAEGVFIRFLSDNFPRESGTWVCELADRYLEPEALAKAKEGRITLWYGDGQEPVLRLDAVPFE